MISGTLVFVDSLGNCSQSRTGRDGTATTITGLSSDTAYWRVVVESFGKEN